MSAQLNNSRKRKLSQEEPAPRKAARTSSTSASTSPVPENKQSKVPKKFEGHTKKERKQNRSTRIYSIRKLLSRDNLPSTVRQDKERELAALLHDQHAVKTKKESRKVLEKYHYVRFIERQKAEKRLKQLRKKLASCEDAHRHGLEQQIHVMEVNRNYTIYCPLNEKYISIFTSNAGKDDRQLEADKQPGSRPPLWSIVEEAMKRGDKALEALRDGKSRTLKQPNTQDTVVAPVDQKRKAISNNNVTNGSGSANLGRDKQKGRDDDVSGSDEDFFER
ncbi:hypothetical protein BT93_L4464 [Corymbia citriodora subsp. variegata]|uniref:rRNA-processing protein EFG1 n=1 Tax=Corymbia citriodora subsp. variegata TaxID=360336 RepID=A0A8T0CFZ3_CORYI|nr:hypothetical protein BT93_L4464 [Corymbia citriodora subsp. variegata]